jgi:MoaA/NifB/PqqE/SkfB family radical SAM enzyme
MNEILSVGDPDILKHDSMQINWVITRRCNYRCSYCSVANTTEPFREMSDLRIAANNISSIKNSKKRVVLTGGEPTLHPSYFEFVEYLLKTCDAGTIIHTVTNLSLSTKYYKHFERFDDEERKRLKASASYHLEFADTTRFVDNALCLSQNGISLKVQLLALPDRFDEIKELYMKLLSVKNEKMIVSMKIIKQGSGPDPRYTREQLDWISTTYKDQENVTIVQHNLLDMSISKTTCEVNEVIGNNLNHFRGMNCYAGLNMLAIDQKGDIYPAVCFRGRRKNILGNIFDLDLNLLAIDSPVVCPFDSCMCLPDIMLPKFREKHDCNIPHEFTNHATRKQAL